MQAGRFFESGDGWYRVECVERALWRVHVRECGGWRYRQTVWAPDWQDAINVYEEGVT